MAEILVAGGSGLVGRALRARLKRRAVGTFRTRPAEGLVPLDLCDAASLRTCFEEQKPQVVVHAAALTDVNLCEREPEKSRAFNVDATRALAVAAKAAGARFVLFSTDYVFDGEHGPHRVDEPRRPLNVYGRHKVEAEDLVLDLMPDALVLRGCNLYGYQTDGLNFAMAALRLAREGKPMRVPVDQYGCPTLAGDVARAVDLAVASRCAGVMHIAGPSYPNRLEWAQAVAEGFGLDPGFVDGVSTEDLNQDAPRPLRAGLHAGDTERVLGFRFASLEQGIASMREAEELEAEEPEAEDLEAER